MIMSPVTGLADLSALHHKLQVKLSLWHSHRHLMSYCTNILLCCSYVARFHV